MSFTNMRDGEALGGHAGSNYESLRKSAAGARVSGMIGSSSTA